MYYRSEIDGLRAVAVAPVLFFHAGFRWAEGGFVGVDVFFVISGYLITSILLRDLDRGQYSITEFYARRVRRIFPALIAVMIACVPMALNVMSPAELKNFAGSMLATSIFASNFFFHLQGGYFAPETEELPLLHTWSLAVEEQFYILFPFALLLIWRFFRQRLAIGLSLIAFGSFMLAQFGGNLNASWPFVDGDFQWLDQPEIASFYLPFGRAWELMAGALIAVTSADKRPASAATSQILSAVGLVMILASVVLYNDRTPFPSAYSLLPVIGTVLVIMYARGNTLTYKILSVRAIVFVGLISYSLYLWHQPLLAFARLTHIGPLSITATISILLICFPLSYLTWRFVETPARTVSVLAPSRVLLIGTFSMLAIALMGAAGMASKGLPSRYSPDYLALTAAAQRSELREDCQISTGFGLHPKLYLDNVTNTCVHYGGKPVVAILGDSHVAELAHGLANRLENESTGVLHFGYDNCPPSLNYESHQSTCNEWTNLVVRQLIDHHGDVNDIILAYRHAYYLYGDNIYDYPHLPDTEPAIYVDGSKNDKRRVYWRNFNLLVDQLVLANKRVHILMPVPELPTSIHKLIRMSDDHSLVAGASRNYYERRQAEVRKRLRSLGGKANLIDPVDALCDMQSCFAVIDSVPMYFDGDHLSVAGAEFLAEKLSQSVLGTLSNRKKSQHDN